MKKKLFAIMCALFVMQMAVWAQEATGYCGDPNVNEGKDVTWKLEVDEWWSGDTTIVISGTGEMANFENPEDRPWNLFANTIKYVRIEDGVTSVGDIAFIECQGLINVGGGYDIKRIGKEAFAGCLNIDFVSLMGEEICENAFMACRGLTTLWIEGSVKSIGDRAFAYCENLDTVKCEAATPPTLGSNVFEGIHPEAELVFDSYVAEDFDMMSAYASSDWAKYFEISVPPMASGYCGDPNVNNGEDVKWELSVDSVLTISGVGAMEDYGYMNNHGWTVYSPWHGYSVTSVIVKEGVTNVGDMAFYDCSLLKSIVIPEGVTSIGNSAFKGCTSLTDITIPNSVASIGEQAFSSCVKLQSIVIPEGVTEIGFQVFVECISMTSVTLPKTLTKIGDAAFAACPKLSSVTIPESVTSIGSGAFMECWALSSITIPEGVTSIGSGVFFNCQSLTSITIPNSVAGIGAHAFAGCSSLSVVTCMNPVPPTLEEGAFIGINSTAILRVPDVDAYKASDWAKCFPTIVGLDTDISAIGGVKADMNTPSAVIIHDLSGRRVTAPVKGRIYIVNGKATVW